MSQVLVQLLEDLATARLRVVDLTQPLSPQTPLLPLPPQFNNTPAFKIWELSHYDDRGPAWYWNGFETGEHTGTHFDAPIHWVSGKDLPDNSVDRIPPKKFIGPACVIDICADAARDPNYLVTPERIRQWEEQNGRIPAGAWLLIRTDWSKRKDPKDYINAKENGPHTPGFNHYLMHGSGKFGLASLCNLDQLPATGAIVIAAPLKIVGGSGSPLRVIALTP